MENQAAEYNYTQKAVYVSGVKIDVQAVAPYSFATSGTNVVQYPHETAYGFALVHVKRGEAAPEISWMTGDPLCSIPSALMSFGIFPVGQEVRTIRCPNVDLQQGDSFRLLVQNLVGIPANISGFPDQSEKVFTSIAFNYK